MNYKNIKLIGLDLDGTLLTSNKEITERTLKAVNAAIENGIEVVPITGRPLAGMPECVSNIIGINYIICSNGSQVMKNGEQLFSFTMSADKTRRIIEKLKKLECIYEVFSDGWGYIENDVNDFYLKHIDPETPVGKYIFSSRKIADSIDEMYQDDSRETDEIFITCNDSDHRARLIDELADIEQIQYCCLADNYIEITNEGTDKGEALKALCDYIGIDLCDTIAFGDAENDLLFLNKAGIAVAMENATDATKAKADIITASNDEDGVAKIIEKIIN